MSAKRILILPGDGIGPEVMSEAVKIIQWLKTEGIFNCELEYADIGGIAIENSSEPLPEITLSLAKAADAVLLGAVGGPVWDNLAQADRPEAGLLAIRRELEVFANLRPAMLFPALASASSLKPELVESLDILICRELTGGLYFGEPRWIKPDANGKRKAANTMSYTEDEVVQIGRIAFELASVRSKRLLSVDKANVLEVSQLWRQVMTSLQADYPDVSLSHMYVDNAAMQLVRNPKQFDVIVTENMFGDILSDLSAMLTGSIGMLPSASLNSAQKGLYEPVHGSAPDIAGMNRANPVAMILSVSMMMKYSLGESKLADLINQAVCDVIESGCRTVDIASSSESLVSCEQMGAAILDRLTILSQNL